MTSAALDWIARAFFPLPIPYRTKRPTIDGWPSLRITTGDASQYFNGTSQNIGVLLGEPYGAADIDLDCHEAMAAAATLAPATGLVFGHASKPASHRFYRSDPPVASKKYFDPSDKAPLCELRCLKSDGTVGLQTVVPPSVHVSGEAIRFEPGFDREPANIDAEVLQRAVARIAAAALLARHWPAAGHGRHDCELSLAGCLARAGWPLDDAEQFVLATYRAVPDHDGGALGRVRTAVQDTFDKRDRGDEITGFTTLAQAVGDMVAKTALKWLGIEGRYVPVAASAQATTGTPELLSQHFSDYGNSQRVIALHGADLRYCHGFTKWLVWDGRRWAVDDGERARDLSQETILEFARQALAAKNGEAVKFAAGCLNSQRISNALREAQPHLAIRPAELDTHADLLNFTNGTVNLRTGALGAHQREHFITKLVHHDYDPHAECPRFLAFLKQITSNHPGLVDYLKRAFGYSLTAHTIEKVIFLLHGWGDNGKTTLLATVLRILEEYAVLLQIDTLMTRQESNNTQADLADLRGARFVMTSETEEGQRLAEGKLKRITQGMGRIKATRKYENPVEFSESHKLWIDSNHLPIVRGTDNAIWNRLHPIPFDTIIPKDEQDKELPAKLASEAEGILAWATNGAVKWYAEGLGKPPDVEQAGKTWRAQSDRLGRFIAECCVTGDFAQAIASRLYSEYQKWSEATGEKAITGVSFYNALQERGYKSDHTRNGNVYTGIGLLAERES